jgi:hypothetical protein
MRVCIAWPQKIYADENSIPFVDKTNLTDSQKEEMLMRIFEIDNTQAQQILKSLKSQGITDFTLGHILLFDNDFEKLELLQIQINHIAKE